VRVRVAVLVILTCALALLPSRATQAQGTFGERIIAYGIDVTVERDGLLRIDERIEYDFGSEPRHGIYRDVVTRQRYDDTYDRVYDLTVERVEADRGASAKYVTESAPTAGQTRIKIGDADKTTTGAHTYHLVYTLAGTLNGFPDHDELYWNVIGAQWTVPIVGATVRVHLPTSASPQVACYAGPTGSSLACDAARPGAGEATFGQASLDAYENLTIVVGFPKGAVPEPQPSLIERWTLQRAFTLDWLRGGAALTLLVVGVWAVVRLVWREGRDVRWRGAPVAVVFGGTAGEQRVPLFEGGAYAIEYTPPDGIRPGQIGTLLDEVAHPRDVSASIVDLAARGYLHIEEIPAEGWFGKPDWRFTRQLPAPEAKVPLRAYEQQLLDGLFESGDIVLLSSLRQHFATRLAKVQDHLYADMVEQGWFAERPDKRRTTYLGVSILALIVTGGLLAAAIIFTTFAVVAVPLFVASLLLLALHGRMPRRTAQGTAALRRTLGFRQFIETAETRRAEFAEQANLFYEYLPYAVVFGCVDKWAKAFEGLALQPPDWYASSSTFNALYFANAMDGFADTTSSALVSTPGGSGSSGFGGSSGGGGGGGGGGSW